MDKWLDEHGLINGKLLYLLFSEAILELMWQTKTKHSLDTVQHGHVQGVKYTNGSSQRSPGL